MVKSMKQLLLTIVCMIWGNSFCCYADNIDLNFFKNDLAFAAIAPAGSGSLDLNQVKMFPIKFEAVVDDFAKSVRLTAKYNLMEAPRSIIFFDKNKWPIGCMIWSPYLKRGRFFVLAACHVDNQKVIQWGVPVGLTLDGYEKLEGKDIRDWMSDFIKKSEIE